jgi:16S rRNA (adenine1518-N6/adenine1519-N6)-dimethyltransferase
MASPRLKKRLGQHHLIAGRSCRPLVRFLRPSGGRVVEIGAGGGVLTAELIDAGAQVIACELDLDWVFALRRRLAGLGDRGRQVAIDALALDWGRVPPGTVVAGNLPYQIATPLIESLLPHWRRVPRAGFLVQTEVAERLVARPGRPGYGALSIVTWARAATSLLATVPRTAFRPPPKVDGAFVGLVPHPPPLDEGEMADFTATVRLCFALRRKTLRNSLASGWGRPLAGRVLETLGYGPTARAEALAPEAFLEIHRAVRELRPATA